MVSVLHPSPATPTSNMDLPATVRLMARVETGPTMSIGSISKVSINTLILQVSINTLILKDFYSLPEVPGALSK